MDDKRTYEPPSVVEIGSVAEQTLANIPKIAIDQRFPAGTPLADQTGS